MTRHSHQQPVTLCCWAYGTASTYSAKGATGLRGESGDGSADDAVLPVIILWIFMLEPDMDMVSAMNSRMGKVVVLRILRDSCRL